MNSFYEWEPAKKERFSLAQERIEELLKALEHGTEDNLPLSPEYRQYFRCEFAFLQLIITIYTEIAENRQETRMYEKISDRMNAKHSNIGIAKWKEWNRMVYEDILSENYDRSYCNPDYTAGLFGVEMGRLWSAVAAEMRVTIPYAYELNQEELLLRMELLLELYTSVSEAYTEGGYGPKEENIRDIIYWYVSDYSEPESGLRVAEMVDPTLDYAFRILMDSDLDNTDYLYLYGEYVTENERRVAEFIRSLSRETIDLIADTFTEGYRKGFLNTGKDLSKKTTVNIRYPLGFERIIRQAVRNFEVMGLKPVIYRAGNSFFRRQGTAKVGYFGANPNKQYDYDHKEDEAIFLTGQFVTRKLECLKAAFEEQKENANGHAGPAVMEIFGETPFVPVVKDTACALSSEQQKLSVKYAMQSGKITNEYITGEERSFTIIAFPIPEIGSNFEEIFADVIRINTLDYMKYQKIQQTLIDVLDRANRVHVKGRGENQTDLWISLHGIMDPERQTQFENCVADVNIPVGEVFTSPKLKGTRGVLHVSDVYLNELEYKNLMVTVKDGMIQSYSCSNFQTMEKNQKYFRDNVLFHHETLPMGEFAIGTNTTAYMMARKYDIAGKLPILIAEKTGPHFAFGDTCYSHAEDVVVYNPDGKEIIARDNEISILRKTEPEKAYFNCHTDITIPYDELGHIIAVDEEGNETVLLKDGRFVLEGCEELNRAFDENLPQSKGS
ncbi:MAG: aminopeptidase [Lachnospiraceae bacterium]